VALYHRDSIWSEQFDFRTKARGAVLTALPSFQPDGFVNDASETA